MRVLNDQLQGGVYNVEVKDRWESQTGDTFCVVTIEEIVEPGEYEINDVVGTRGNEILVMEEPGGELYTFKGN